MGPVLQQIRRNAVAIISLLVALSSLGYNTWRNELTEHNRNIRTASFEVLKALGELQVIADHAHYDRDRERGNPITGWGRVTLIRDLCSVIPGQARLSASRLHATWGEHWASLGETDTGIEPITRDVNRVRDAVMTALVSLN